MRGTQRLSLKERDSRVDTMKASRRRENYRDRWLPQLPLAI